MGRDDDTRVITKQRRQRQARSVDTRTRLERYAAPLGVLPAIQPGLDPDSPAVDAQGDDRHAFGESLGRGGVGKVCLATDRDLRRTVALKTLHEPHAREPLMLRAFLEEAVITGGLEHPNIVPVYEVGVSEALGPYYTMKRLDGEPLDRVLSRLRKGAETPSLVRLVEYFAQALRAMAYAHGRGVIHCDLKPSNILVGRFGEVVVVDWGLAKVLDATGERQARAQIWSGSPGYMPPEQSLGADYGALDERSDVWSLGAILYELLTLTLPFADAKGQVDEDIHWRDFPTPSARAPARHVPAELEAICMAALARDPDQRPASAEEMLAGIEAYLEGALEARRRDEAVLQALETANACSAAVAAEEQAIDALQAMPTAGRPSPADLEAARAAALAGYERAAATLALGLDASAADARLAKAAADVYWRIFRRIYPAQTPTEDATRRRALALLQTLSQLAPAAIVGAFDGVVAAPASLPVGEGTPSADDPWLAAVTAISQEPGLEREDSPILEVVQRIRCLRGVPIFADLSGPELLPIAEAATRQAFGSGETLFDSGDSADALYVIVSGEVDIVRSGTRLVRLGRGGCFGEVAIIDGATRTAGAVAVGRVDTLALTAQRFRGLIEADGRVGLAVMRVLAQRLRAATEREMAQLAQGGGASSGGAG